jgi:hypothetical protein
MNNIMVDENHPFLYNQQFSLPHVVNSKLVIVINHSISRIFQKFRMNKNPNFVSFVFLVKFKCNRGHIHGLN